MKKNAVIVAVVVLLVVLVGGYYFMKKGPSKPSTTSNTASQDSSPKSLKDLLMSGIAQKCTFSSTTSTGSSDGTTYMASGKVRGDFSMTTDSKTTKSHMIVDGKTSYIWTDGQTTGFKTTIPDETAATPGSQTTNATVNNSASSFDQKADYKCEAWSVDQSLFILPTGVTFKDMSVLIPSMAPTTSGSNSSQCSYCNNLTGDSKVQCLAALKCN